MRTVKSLVSEGTVWRYDPKLAADIAARAEEVAREAALKAARAAEAARQDTNLKTVLFAGDLTRDNALLNADPGLIARRDEDGKTPLHWAAENNSKDVAELLIAKGADVNGAHKFLDVKDIKPLYVAVKSNFKDVTELLIDKGAYLWSKDTVLIDSLFIAAKSNSKDVTELLIDKGADVNARDKSAPYVTPLLVAIKSKSTDVA